MEPEIIDLTGPDDGNPEPSVDISPQKTPSPGKQNRKERREELRRQGELGRPNHNSPTGKDESQTSGSHKRRRSSSRERRRRSASPKSHKHSADTSEQLFFIDIQPAQLPALIPADDPKLTTEATGPAKLLLPEHVSVFGVDPVEIVRPPTPEPGEEDFIEYLDYDDRRVRLRPYIIP